MFYIPPSDGYVEFSADVFRDSDATVVRAYGARQNQEYLLFQGQGAQAELIYSAMNNVGESFYHEADALEFFPFKFLARNKTWKINRNQPKDWGVKTSYQSKVDPFYETQTFTYAPYRLVNSERHCFNFETKWDEPGYDPDFSPRQVLFGYYCAPPGCTLSKQRIQGLIRSLHVRSDTGEFFIEFRIDRPPANRSAQALPVEGHWKLQADELQHLRRENTRLRQEREILEKVTALLVTQSSRDNDFIRR